MCSKVMSKRGTREKQLSVCVKGEGERWRREEGRRGQGGKRARGQEGERARGQEGVKAIVAHSTEEHTAQGTWDPGGGRKTDRESCGEKQGVKCQMCMCHVVCWCQQ